MGWWRQGDVGQWEYVPDNEFDVPTTPPPANAPGTVAYGSPASTGDTSQATIANILTPYVAPTYQPDPGGGAQPLLLHQGIGDNLDKGNIIQSWNQQVAANPQLGLLPWDQMVDSVLLPNAPADVKARAKSDPSYVMTEGIPRSYMTEEESDLPQLAAALGLTMPALMGITGMGSGIFDSIGNFFGGSGVNPLAAGAELPWGGVTEVLSGGIVPQVGGVSATSGLMPPAVPETAAQLSEWGLVQTSPGVWQMPNGGTLNLGTGGGTGVGGGGSPATGGTTGGTTGGAGTGLPGGTPSGSTSGSALSRILSGTATGDDYLSAAGSVGSSLLGLLGSQSQTKAYTDLAKQYMDFGAPSRARFEASMTPGFAATSIPGYQGAVDTASESILRKLSATGGNPFGNPGGLIEANKAIISGTALPAINEYQRLNANTGFGASMNAAVPFQTAAIGSEGNALNALGYGLGQLTQPPKQDLASLLRQLSGTGQLSLT